MDYQVFREAVIKLGGVPIFSWSVDPLGKPRMTQRDKWRERPAVMRYRAFRDEIGYTTPPDISKRLSAHDRHFAWAFLHPMPKSWSKKKKADSRWAYMRQKPDIDNVLKAVYDTLCTEDKHISFVMAAQFWEVSGRIILFELPLRDPASLDLDRDKPRQFTRSVG